MEDPVVIDIPKRSAEDLKIRARIVVVEQVCHQLPGNEDPTAIESRFAKWLTNDEVPYVRKPRIGVQWVPLETGWLSSVSLLCLSNDEGKSMRVYPTEQEKEALANRVIQVGVSSHAISPGMPIGEPTIFTEIHPGESCRFTPHDLSRLFIRCREVPGMKLESDSSAKITITAFPL